MTRSWTGAVFIGTSVDGRIAQDDGGLDWLTTRGEAAGDAGYTPFIESVDAVLLGRSTYEALLGFDEWPYGDRVVVVLSTTLDPDADERVRVARDLTEADRVLTGAGATRVYVDGGKVITSCLDAGLVGELVISQVPVVLGQGPHLFGRLGNEVALEHVSTEVFGGGMVQTRYRVLPSA